MNLMNVGLRRTLATLVALALAGAAAFLPAFLEIAYIIA